MKLDIKKHKKVIIIASAAVLTLGVLAGSAYSKINDLENTTIGVESGTRSLDEYMLIRNDLIIDSKDELQKGGLDKDLLDTIENQTKDLKNTKKVEGKFYKMNEINDRIDFLEKLDESVDKLIAIYDGNKDMQKNEELSKKMQSIIEADYSVEDSVKSFNNIDAKEFNEAIEKFPANAYAKNKGWEVINKMN